jgi:transposase
MGWCAGSYPMLRHIFADGGYAGPKLREALKAIGRWTVQIVKRSDTADGFEVLPRRWVVERPHSTGHTSSCKGLKMIG